MTTYVIQFPHETSAFAKFLDETRRQDDLGCHVDLGGHVDVDGLVVEFGQALHDHLTGLPDDCDGHIDPNGFMWVDGADYPVGTL